MSLHLKRNRILALVMAFTFAFSLVRPAVVYAQDELPVDAVEQEVEQQVLEQTLALLPAETEVVVLSDAGEVLPLASQEAVEVLIAGDPMWCPEGKLPGDVACTASYTNLSELLSNLGGKTGNGTIYVASDYDSKNANDYGNNFIIDQTGDSFGVNNENKLITAQLSTLDALTIQGGWNFTTNQLDTVKQFSVFEFGTGSFSIQNWADTVTLNNIHFQNTTGGSSESFGVSGSGDVSLNNVEVTGSGGDAIVGQTNYKPGFKIVTTGDVSVENGIFSENKTDGLMIASYGDITLKDIDASSNVNAGVIADNCQYDNTGACAGSGGTITLQGANTFTQNGGTGIEITAGGIVTQAANSTLTASQNAGSGMELYRDGTTTSQAIDMLGSSSFAGNNYYGLLMLANGDITLNNITATGNGNDGYGYSGAHIHNLFEGDVDLEAYGSMDAPAIGQGGSLTLTGSNTFDNNRVHGLEASIDGTINAENLEASGNGYLGALLTICPGFWNVGDMICYSLPDTEDDGFNIHDYDVTISGNNLFVGNYAGLAVHTLGDITLGTTDSDSFTTKSHYYTGAYLESGLYGSYYDEYDEEWFIDDDAWYDGGNITLNGSHTYGGDNEETDGNVYGLYAGAWSDSDPDNGNVTMTNAITAKNNMSTGLWIDASGKVDLTGAAKVFTQNETGLYIADAYSGVDISNVTVSNNYSGIILRWIDGDVNLSNSSLSGNNTGFYARSFDPEASMTVTNTKINKNNTGFYGYELGDVTFTSSEFNDNSQNAFQLNTAGDLTFTSSKFNNNGNGFLVTTAGDVTFDKCEVTGNFELEKLKSAKTMVGNALIDVQDVSVTDSHFDNNYFNGLAIDWKAVNQEHDGKHAVTISNSSFNGNGDPAKGGDAGDGYEGIGLFLVGAADPFDESLLGSVSISGVEANGNRVAGMGVIGANDVTITGSSANKNGEAGLAIYTTAEDVTISNSTFNETGGSEDPIITGLGFLYNSGDITLSGVQSSNNEGLGLYAMYTGGDLTITNSSFLKNYYNGIGIEDTEGGLSILNTVSSTDPEHSKDEVALIAGGVDSATITCSSFNGNFSGNAVIAAYGDIVVTGSDVFSMTVTTEDGEVIFLQGCGVSVKKPVESNIHVVPVMSGALVPLECSYSGTILVMETNEKAAFSGFCGQNASFEMADSGSLPGALPAGMDYVSGYNGLVDGVSGILPDNGRIGLNLAAGAGAENLAVLWWDAAAGEWVEIPLAGNEGDFAASDGGMQVLSGAVFNADGSVSFTVNFTGTFVVVTK